jgi:hypothetical protein
MQDDDFHITRDAMLSVARQISAEFDRQLSDFSLEEIVMPREVAIIVLGFINAMIEGLEKDGRV